MPDTPAASPAPAANSPPGATPQKHMPLPPPVLPAPPAKLGVIRGPDPTRYGDWERGGRCIDF